LLEKDLNGESFRRISEDFGFSETALRRHLNEHLAVELSQVKAAKEAARAEALEAVKVEELEDIKDRAMEGMAARLENAAGFLDQLKEVRSEAANLLDKAEKSDDLKAAGVFLREVREQIKLMAELEGKLASQPQITIIDNPEWVELRAVILTALDDFPEAKAAVVHAIRK
jgi:flagellar biosynthesis chaperone FliJ